MIEGTSELKIEIISISFSFGNDIIRYSERLRQCKAKSS